MVRATYEPGGLIVGDYPVAHRTVTIAAGAGKLKRGTVLGRRTATKKYVLSEADTSFDGSDVPRAVLAEDVDAESSDVQAPAYFSGEFAADKLIYGADHTKTSVEAAWEEAGVPLFVRDRV